MIRLLLTSMTVKYHRTCTAVYLLGDHHGSVRHSNVGQGFVKNPRGLIACRLLMGLFEAALFPGCLYQVSSWYKRYELQWWWENKRRDAGERNWRLEAKTVTILVMTIRTSGTPTRLRALV